MENNIENPSADWHQYCAEVQRGKVAVLGALRAASPQPENDVQTHAMAETQLCRPRIANAIASLLDERKIIEKDDTLAVVAEQ